MRVVAISRTSVVIGRITYYRYLRNSEGVVALVEPFIDTIVICTMTGLVIIMTGVWDMRFPTEITLDGGDISYVVETETGH